MRDDVIAGYELWDTESRNLLDDFDSEREALAAVRDLIASNGVGCADALALTRIASSGRMTTLARGAELLRLVESSGREPERRFA